MILLACSFIRAHKLLSLQSVARNAKKLHLQEIDTYSNLLDATPLHHHATIMASVIPALNRCHRRCLHAIDVALIPSAVCKMQMIIC